MASLRVALKLSIESATTGNASQPGPLSPPQPQPQPQPRPRPQPSNTVRCAEEIDATTTMHLKALACVVAAEEGTMANEHCHMQKTDEFGRVVSRLRFKPTLSSGRKAFEYKGAYRRRKNWEPRISVSPSSRKRMNRDILPNIGLLLRAHRSLETEHKEFLVHTRCRRMRLVPTTRWPESLAAQV